MRTIGIWCEHNFQVYSALPVIKKYSSKNKVLLFTKEINVSEIKNKVEVNKNFKIITIDKYISKTASLFKVIFETLLVSENFSYVYKHEFVNKEPLKRRVIRKLFFLKLPNNKVNKVFLSLNSFFFHKKTIDNHFNLDLLVSFSKIHYSYLIPLSKNVPHINIMESWDHPMKFPYYIFPSFNLTWNKDLAIDTKEIQHLKRVKKIMPLKFKYLYDYVKFENSILLEEIKKTNYYPEIQKLEDKKIVLYPTTTSSSGLMHEGEMRLLEELCEIFENSDYFLYIKPKPNAPVGDYDIFKSYKNVIIGIYSNNNNASDMLNANYHKFRYLLLHKSEVVLNVGTTFGLEAAIANKKIVQLDLQNDYLGFAGFCKTYHLKKYVLSLNNVFKYKANKEDLLTEIKNCNYEFSKQLKDWITKF